jgi:transposase InsO family protein
MEADAKRRRAWVELYLKTGDAGLTCRRCGISRPTLRKWIRRFKASGEAGLVSISTRPSGSPNRRIDETVRKTILELRRTKNIGARRIQIELGFAEDLWLSRTIIQRVLDGAGVQPLRHPRRPETPKRYSRPIPGDRVQLDTIKIGRGLYQYTAVDDCSRFRVLGLYPRRSGKYTVVFLERVIEEMPFPIQRVQTDRGTEFFAEQVQNFLKENFIKFRPIPPRSPHLNGKVERSQLTDLQEFWANRKAPALQDADDLECWQFDYNWRRPHGSLHGKRPIDRVVELSNEIPNREEVALQYDPAREPLRFSNWAADMAMNTARQLHQARQRALKNNRL